MENQPPTDPASRQARQTLMERVIERSLEGESEHGLLDAAMALGASAAAVWRPLAIGRRDGGQGLAWQAVRSRGDAAELPPNSTLQAHFGGSLACGLPPSCLALGGPDNGLGLAMTIPTGRALDPSQGYPPALALQINSADRDETTRDACADLLEALLKTVCEIEQGDNAFSMDQIVGLEGLSGLLPSRESPPTDSPPTKTRKHPENDL